MTTPAARSPVRSSGVPWSALARLIRLHNQTGTYLLLLPTLWALVLATRGVPPLNLLVIFLAGSFLMRSAGVILNDLADRSFDQRVSRTKNRPLASGELPPRYAFALLGLLLLMAGLLLLLLNPLVFRLAPVALLLAALYPFSKRWIHIPQAVLGLAFGWGTVMAWAAVQGQLDLPAWMLLGATAAWAVVYDTIYAIQDREDDRRIGVKSAALFFGSYIHLGVGAAFAVMLALLGAAGWMSHIGWAYYGTLLVAGVLCLRQIGELRKPVDPSQAFRIFRAQVWIGAAILGGMVAGFLV